VMQDCYIEEKVAPVKFRVSAERVPSERRDSCKSAVSQLLGSQKKTNRPIMRFVESGPTSGAP